MEQTLSRAKLEDSSSILNIYIQAKKSMKDLGIDQWQTTAPNEKTIIHDIESNSLWALENNNNIIAVAALTDFEDPNYKTIDGAWLQETTSYITIHRIAILNSFKGKRISDLFMKKAEKLAMEKHFKSIRIDTHKDNIPMQKWIKRHGFSFCGIIQVADGTDRNAYEKILL